MKSGHVGIRWGTLSFRDVRWDFLGCFGILWGVCRHFGSMPHLLVPAQLVLLVGKLNTLAAVVTVFYLVAYAAVDLSCLSLEWASAPNFR